MAALLSARLGCRMMPDVLILGGGRAGSPCDVTLWIVSRRVIRGRRFGVDEAALVGPWLSRLDALLLEDEVPE